MDKGSTYYFFNFLNMIYIFMLNKIFINKNLIICIILKLNLFNK